MPLLKNLGALPRLHLFSVGMATLLMLAAATACVGGAPVVELGWAGPVVDGGAVFIGSRAGKFFRLSTSDISEAQPLDLASKTLVPLWQFPVTTDKKDKTLGAIYGQPAVNKTTVYIALNRVENGVAKAGVASALDRETGVERWSYQTQGRMFGSPVLDDTALYLTDDAGYIYALDSATGNVLWKVLVATKRFWSTPAIAGKSLFVGSMDKNLYALDLATGKTKWTFKAGGAITSRPLVIGDGVYFGAFDRNFYKVSATSGQKVWSFRSDAWFWNDAVATTDGGTIFVGSLGENVYALDANSGAARWAYNTGSAVRAAPILRGALVYVTALSGQIYALDAANGTLRKSAPVLGAQALASPAWSGGFLYVHDMKEKLHKIPASA